MTLERYFIFSSYAMFTTGFVMLASTRQLDSISLSLFGAVLIAGWLIDEGRAPAHWELGRRGANWLMAVGPLAIIGPLTFLPRPSFVTAFGIIGTALALSCWFGWHLFVRPRAAWNGAGIAIVGMFGSTRLRWYDVLAIEAKDGIVTVWTAERGWSVPAVSLPGPLRGTRYNADQLVTALRLAHERGPGAPTTLDPPRLAAPATPLWPYLLWLGWSAVLAWLFQELNQR